MRPDFLLVTCHVGAERVLRGAIPGARPAFARPGLLTFRCDAPVSPRMGRPHPLARAWGVSAGAATSPSELAVAIAGLPGPVHVQVSAGEAGPIGRVPHAVTAAWEAEARGVAEVLAGLGAAGPPVDGATVLDVIVRPAEPWRLAWHVHTSERGPLPQGRWPVEVPADAPSRAWATLEELWAWSSLAPAAGDLVLELGCAPGGATAALLDRGARVVGVDPQPMQLPARLAGRDFVHVARLVESVRREELPDGVQWIVLDTSVAAPVALRSLQRLVKRYRGSLRGVFATLKLNDWALVDRWPEWRAQIESWGLTVRGPANLPSFRQEVGLVAR